MGEYADMMIDGDACSLCGVTLYGPLAGNGVPALCRDCRRQQKSKQRQSLPFRCDYCGKRVSSQIGLKQHTAAVHGL